MNSHRHYIDRRIVDHLYTASVYGPSWAARSTLAKFGRMPTAAEWDAANVLEAPAQHTDRADRMTA